MKNFFYILRLIVARRGFFIIFYFVCPANDASSASTASRMGKINSYSGKISKPQKIHKYFQQVFLQK